MRKKNKLIGCFKMTEIQHENLDFVECNNVTALDILIDGLNCESLLNKGVHRYKVIDNS